MTGDPEQRELAFEAFMALTKAVGSETDMRVLAVQAVEVIMSVLPDSGVGYYELEDGRWKARAVSANVDPELAALIRAGLPFETPSFLEAVRAGTAVFTPGWDARKEGVPLSASYGAAAFYPYFQAGQPVAMLTAATQQAKQLSASEQSIFNGVGHSLALALERAAQTQELQTRNAALDAYVRFTAQVATATDLKVLVAAADSIIWEALGDSLCAYYLVQGNWALPEVFSLGVRPDLQARLEQGIPMSLPVVQEAFVRRDIAFAEQSTGRDQAEQVVGSPSVTALSVMPYFRGGQPYALFSSGSKRPTWTPREKAIIHSVGQGLGAATERLEQVQRLEHERQTLATFVDFTENAGAITELETLTRKAFVTLQALFPGCTAALYEWQGGLWRARFDTDDMAPELLALIRAGLPETASVFPQLLQTRRTVFVNHWSQEEQDFAHTGDYQTAALYPIEQAGGIHAALGLASRHQATWSVQDRAIVNAVGRSFSLLYDRVTATETLERRRLEAESHIRALEGFAELTRDLAVESEPDALIRQALNVIHQLLPEGYVTFQQPEDGVWRTRILIGDRRSPELQQTLDEGVPYASAPSLMTPWTSGQPMFQDAYKVSSDGVQLQDVQIRALATLPIMVQGQPYGVLAAALFGAQHWAGVNQVVLETVVRSLEQAIGRAQGAGALVERSRELQAANNELEAFSYSVSHDLRTPVRHVKGFSELARRALENADIQQALAHMLVVEKAALRMNTLIDAMLDLARTSQQELKMGAVDLNALVKRAMRDVEQDRVGGEVTWNVAPLPTVQGDQATLQQVINNLLANAVKYSRTRPEAVIEVWAEETSGQQTLYVRDNGVGFSPVYRDRLFGVFQRLHTDREFEGTGVGLAIVRRIVLRHRGSVFADGVPDQGATFGFSLPHLLRA